MKLINLNIEGRKHWGRINPLLESEKPDVICLQEIFESDAEQLAKRLSVQYVFAPMTFQHIDYSDLSSPYEPLGIAMFIHPSFANARTEYYHVPNPELMRIDVTNFDTRRKTVRQVVIAADIMLDGKKFTVATTHFTLTSKGLVSDNQRTDAAALIRYLSKMPEVVLCGDFNIPRGYNETYDLFVSKYIDAIPKSYVTSLDPSLHRAAGDPVEGPRVARFMVDYLFLSKGYIADQVRLQSGVSDHCAIVATIESRA